MQEIRKVHSIDLLQHFEYLIILGLFCPNTPVKNFQKKKKLLRSYKKESEFFIKKFHAMTFYKAYFSPPLAPKHQK